MDEPEHLWAANLLLKKVLVTLFALFGAPIMIRRPGNCAPFSPLVTPLRPPSLPSYANACNCSSGLA